jgi:hypothetical protein
LRDRDVRVALYRKVLKEHEGQPDTKVVDELGLRHGVGRVDVAVINGTLHGFEIKSDSDTLERLPGQIQIYNSVLDKVTLVCGERHADKVLTMIPEWWGLKIAALGVRQAIHFHTARMPKFNRHLDAIAVAELLWRDEVVEILSGLGVPGATLRKPRAVLYRYLASAIELEELRNVVRQRLKSRANWRDRQPPL